MPGSNLGHKTDYFKLPSLVLPGHRLKRVTTDSFLVLFINHYHTELLKTSLNESQTINNHRFNLTLYTELLE